MPYLKNVDNEILFDIMFSLKSRNFEKDTIVLAEEQTANSLFLIEEGILEVYTHFENEEFVLERLFPGSAVNHRAYFMQDLMYVNVRCTTQAKLLELTYQTMKEVQERHIHKKFSNEILFYQNRILKQERKFPLDYIMQIPKTVGWAPDDMARRELSLKNVVMRIIIEIRERKKRPKLSDFLAVYKTKKDEPDAKEQFQKKFMMLYSGEEADNTAEDSKFDQLTKTFGRIQK